jgi:predicted membrane protein
MIYINRFIALVIFIGIIIPFGVVGFLVSVFLIFVQYPLYIPYSFIKNGEFSLLKEDDYCNNKFIKLMDRVEDLYDWLREKNML